MEGKRWATASLRAPFRGDCVGRGEMEISTCFGRTLSCCSREPLRPWDLHSEPRLRDVTQLAEYTLQTASTDPWCCSCGISRPHRCLYWWRGTRTPCAAAGGGVWGDSHHRNPMRIRMPGPQRAPCVAALPRDNTAFTHRAREELGCSSTAPLPSCRGGPRVPWKGTLRKPCPIQGSKPNTGP